MQDKQDLKRLGPENILIINDDRTSCKLFEAYLTRAGYSVHSSESSKDAFKYLATHSIDLLFLDLVLRSMHGLTVLQRLKSTAATRDIPVIVTTVHDELYTEAQIIKAGAAAYLKIPAEQQNIITLVKRILQEEETKILGLLQRANDSGVHSHQAK